jgi:hypothetical protein
VLLYRPPSGNKNEFTYKLIEWIESLGNKLVYIAGDFNLNSLNSKVEHFRAIKNNTGLQHRINEVTRIQSGISIDNIITNINGKHIVSQICIADHQGLTSSLKVKTQRKVQKKFKYRAMQEQNWNKFSQEVNKLVTRESEINEKWNNLTSDIKKYLINHSLRRRAKMIIILQCPEVSLSQETK